MRSPSLRSGIMLPRGPRGRWCRSSRNKWEESISLNQGPQLLLHCLVPSDLGSARGRSSPSSRKISINKGFIHHITRRRLSGRSHTPCSQRGTFSEKSWTPSACSKTTINCLSLQDLINSKDINWLLGSKTDLDSSNMGLSEMTLSPSLSGI